MKLLEKLRVINQKHSLLDVGIVLCLVLALIGMGFSIHANHEVEEIENAASVRYSMQSINYTDFDPCTLDVLATTTQCNGMTSNEVVHLPLSNGSCCNQNDFCYRDDPEKVCLYGKCQSPDPTKCKGYCTTLDDCTTIIPLTVDPNAAFYNNFCVFNACGTFVMFNNILIADPYTLIDTRLSSPDRERNTNISACLNVVCVTQYEAEGATYCTFTWKCAPYVNMSGPVYYDRKRAVMTNERDEALAAFLRDARKHFQSV